MSGAPLDIERPPAKDRGPLDSWKEAELYCHFYYIT